MTVREDEIERPDGSRGIYGVVHRPDSVLVVPWDGTHFHLVEEFRYPLGRRSWSFPQGSAPEATREAEARRELAEETGLRAGRVRPLGLIDDAHGTSTQRLHVFLATDLTAGESAREHTEQDMRQSRVSRAEFEAMVRGEQVTDSSSIAAYAMLLLGPALP
ncbi:NUDIX domain-containing protein [Sinosporangium album]|nr:NUDIX hydrolase [Sinosporangium album]